MGQRRMRARCGTELGLPREADDTVEPAGSIEPLTQLQHCTTPPPVEALLTTYEDADHDSWTRTYAVGAEHDIYTWMLGFSHS